MHDLDHNYHEIRRLAGLIVITTVVVVAIMLAGFLTAHEQASHEHRVLIGVSENGRLTERASARTECIRQASAALDAARWDKIAALLQLTSPARVSVIGHQIQALPNVLHLANHGGVIAHVRFMPCPPPLSKSPTS